MRKGDRIMVYFAGVMIGMVLVSFLVNRKHAREEARVDPWLAHNTAMVNAGAEPLPDHADPAIVSGRMIDYGLLPNEEAATDRVWLLNFDKSYPYVRVVEEIASGDLTYMAADQIIVELSDGTDVTELKPMLDELGLRMRMFNRKGGIAVLGVLHTGIGAVPDTLSAIEPWSVLYKSAEPDWIRFRNREKEKATHL